MRRLKIAWAELRSYFHGLRSRHPQITCHQVVDDKKDQVILVGCLECLEIHYLDETFPWGSVDTKSVRPLPGENCWQASYGPPARS